MALGEDDAEAVQVMLVAAGPVPGVAAGHLAARFALPPDRAEMIVARGRGLVAVGIRRDVAKRSVALLAMLGLQLAIHPLGTAEQDELVDISLRVAGSEAGSNALNQLHALGLAVTGEDFTGPSGLLISDLPRQRADLILSHLQNISGLEVASCAQSQSRHDLFAGPGGLRAEHSVILRHLADAGYAAAFPWPVLAQGLDLAMLRRLDARFPGHGLLAVNQKFQRYDLTLIGLGDVSARDFADFLTTRGHTPSATFQALRAGQGLRMESGLTRATAAQFLADYAMIGLQVRADLARPLGKPVKMPWVKPGFTQII